MHSRQLLLALLMIPASMELVAQLPEQYKSGLNAEQNLTAIGKLNPNAAGGTGYDERYQGVKGSPMLFDTLLSSLLRVKGMNEYLKLTTDIDAAGNNLVYLNPASGKKLSIPANQVTDLFMQNGKQVFHFRTTESFRFEKQPRETRFCEVLGDSVQTLIKIADKIFVAADYRGAYTADRRFDEFKTEYKYYVRGADSLFYQINLSGKSLSKVFPGSKTKIDSFDERNFGGTKEEMIIEMLRLL